MGSSRRTGLGRPAGLGRGFTVVEILVVLGIVIGVISTLVVGLGFAARRARVANTEFLMNSIVAGMTRFRAETGYIPPILGDAQQVSASGNVSNPNGNTAPQHTPQDAALRLSSQGQGRTRLSASAARGKACAHARK